MSLAANQFFEYVPHTWTLRDLVDVYARTIAGRQSQASGKASNDLLDYDSDLLGVLSRLFGVEVERQVELDEDKRIYLAYDQDFHAMVTYYNRVSAPVFGKTMMRGREGLRAQYGQEVSKLQLVHSSQLLSILHEAALRLWPQASVLAFSDDDLAQAGLNPRLRLRPDAGSFTSSG